MPVAEAQERVSSAEFVEWVAYFRREPFGPLTEAARFGVLATLLHAAHRDPGRGRALGPEDFFPELKAGRPGRGRFDSPKGQQMLAQIYAALHQPPPKP